MFSLVQVDNRVDISSSGIDFRITGAYISGTSYMVAHIEAIGYNWDVTLSSSGTMANVRLLPIEILFGNLCNCYISKGAADGMSIALVNDFSDWDGSAITHTGTLMHIVDGSDIGSPTMRPASILSNDEYIYMSGRRAPTGLETQYTLQVREFSVYSGTYATGTVDGLADVSLSDYEDVGTGYGTWMTYAGDREIFVWDSQNIRDSEDTADHETGHHFYRVTFPSGTATDLLTIWNYDGGGWNQMGVDGYTHYFQYERFPQGIFSIIDRYGDVHLLIVETYKDWSLNVPYGVGVWHDINGGGFTEYIVFRSQQTNASWANSCWFYGIVHGNQYLSSSSFYISNAGETENKILNFTFDVLDPKLSYGDNVNEQGPFTSYPVWYSCVEDITTGKVYLNADINGTHKIFEYDRYTQQFGAEVGGDDYLFASKTDAYRWQSNDQIYKMSTGGIMSTVSRPALMQSASMIMDDNGYIYYMDSGDIKAVNVSSGVQVDSFPTGIASDSLLVLMGNTFTLSVINGKYVYYYLVK